MIKTCKLCKNLFKLIYNNQKYCSKKCSIIAIREQHLEWNNKNPKVIVKAKIKYYSKIQPKYNKIYAQKWRKTHRDSIKKYKNTFVNKVINRVRVRTLRALKGIYKVKPTIKLLGCSVKQLKLHLKNQFTKGMTWKNYGKWHIDHIKPCCSFDLNKAREQIKCFHYSNLQPLWAKDNYSKGGKKVWTLQK